MNMVQAINDALRLEMKRDERVVVLGEDVGQVGGVFRVTQGLWDEFGDDRVIDTPLSEGGIIGTAIGMALYGLVPVPEIQFADFIFPGVRPDRERAGEDALALRRRVLREDGHPHAGRRRHPRRPLSLAVARVALHPRGGPQGRLPVEPVRREGPAARVDPRSGSGALLRAEAHLPRARGEVPEGDYTVPLVEGEGRARGDAGRPAVTILAWGAMLYEAHRRGREGRRAGHRLRGRRPAHALAARHRDDRREREEDRPRRRRARGAEDLRLRRRAHRAHQREVLLPPRGAAGPRDRLRHAVPVHARDGVPAARPPDPSGDRRDGRVTDTEKRSDGSLGIQAAGHRRRRHRGRDRQLARQAGRHRQGRPADGRGDDRQGHRHDHVAEGRHASSRRVGAPGTVVAVHSVLVVFELDANVRRRPTSPRAAHASANGNGHANGGAAKSEPGGDRGRRHQGEPARHGRLRAAPRRAPRRAAAPRAAVASSYFNDEAARDAGDAQARARHGDRSPHRPAHRPAGPRHEGRRRDASRKAPKSEREPAAPPRRAAARPMPAPGARRREDHRAARAAQGALEERVPFAGVRRKIAQKMAQSVHTAAHFTFVEECDVHRAEGASRAAQAVGRRRRASSSRSCRSS